jgi:hypothetical protein
MARKNPRIHRNEQGDRLGLRDAHNSFAPVPLHDLHGQLRPLITLWCEFAVTAVAVMCIAPALVVGCNYSPRVGWSHAGCLGGG